MKGHIYIYHVPNYNYENDDKGSFYLGASVVKDIKTEIDESCYVDDIVIDYISAKRDRIDILKEMIMEELKDYRIKKSYFYRMEKEEMIEVIEKMVNKWPEDFKKLD